MPGSVRKSNVRQVACALRAEGEGQNARVNKTAVPQPSSVTDDRLRVWCRVVRSNANGTTRSLPVNRAYGGANHISQRTRRQRRGQVSTRRELPT